MGQNKVFQGRFVYSLSRDRLVGREDAYLVVTDGVSRGIFDTLPEEYEGLPQERFSGVMIPAFSDLHVHAPQYPQRGLAMDALLYDWLHRYTFPLERKYEDIDFAKSVYDAFVDDLLAHGTMHAAIYGTIHREATGYLIERLEKLGVRAYVGKVNMDTDSPSYLSETVEESVKETERFLDAYSGNRYALPILTPRFAPTCSRDLLERLGGLAKKYRVGVQTHLVESLWEKEEAVRRYPDCSCDTGIYERAGLLGHGPFFGGHFIFPSDEDVRILKKYDGYAVHCPEATVNVIAGAMPTAELSERGVSLALGSDVAAGQSLALYSQVARAVQLSKIKSFYEKGVSSLSFAQAFFTATKGGGSAFGKVGSLENGYDFDAFVIDGVADPFMPLSPEETVERFCYAGERKHIKRRFLRGTER